MLTERIARENIAAVVSRWTGIPVVQLTRSEADKLMDLKGQLHERVVGQNAAVGAVADAVLRSRAGLAASERGSSFLFLGPTGVRSLFVLVLHTRPCLWMPGLWTASIPLSRSLPAPLRLHDLLHACADEDLRMQALARPSWLRPSLRFYSTVKKAW